VITRESSFGATRTASSSCALERRLASRPPGRFTAFVISNHFHLVIEAQLAQWPKGHPFKVQLVAEVRVRTTVTFSWLADRLSMGTRGYLVHLLSLNAPSKTDPGPGNQLRLEI
jgi:hypothetical protein